MNEKFENTTTPGLLCLVFCIVLFSELINAQDVAITIHLRGVSESRISLLPLAEINSPNPVAIVQSIKNGETTVLKVPQDNLPGEFVLRFDYKENPTNPPYPSEKRIIINNQDLNLWVHPIYCNNADSTYFQDDEIENTTYAMFLDENARQKEMLGLLQNFLLNYDDTQSRFYHTGIKEYEKRRKNYNQWISEETRQQEALFVSSMFSFNHIPRIEWTGTENDRKQSLRENYLDGMDFNNTHILKTYRMKEWMDGYVNLYGELATSISLRDSLFTLAGKTAIEKARSGHPQVYGWMVDYFFNGYETINIESGIKMLEPYLDDPNCLASQREAILIRLENINTSIPGTKTPN
jgi:hypothetical protein